MKAVCIDCGNIKDYPWRECRQCGLDPSRNETMLVKSVYLSTGRYETPAEQLRYSFELDDLSKRIREGQKVEFPQEELDRLLEQKGLIDSVSRWSLAVFLVKTFFPILIAIASAIGIGFLLNWLTHR